MLCPISGKIPHHPVVTPQGNIYEERLLTEYRKAHGDNDPVTGEVFNPDLLIKVNNGATPDVSHEAQSINQLLAKIQSEFDVVLLQNFTLRSALDKMKGQLSQSLYQHDAACRVIARLTRERELWKSNKAATSSGTEITNTLSAEKLQEISENALDLQSVRKTVNLSLVTSESLDKWRSVASAMPHEAARPGINDLAVKDQGAVGHVAVTAGQDGHITMTELKSMTRVSRFEVDKSAVTCLDIHSDTDVIVAGCHDKSLRFFTGSTTESGDLNFSLHKLARSHREVPKFIEIHPLGDFVMSGSVDNGIVFTDIDSGRAMCSTLQETCGLASLCFHPDGNLFVTGGSDSSFGVWDIREMSEKMRTKTNESGSSLTGITVGANGYYLSTCDSGGSLKVFDLRRFHPTTNKSPVVSSQVVADVTDVPFTVAMGNHSSIVAVGGKLDSGLGILKLGSIGKKAKEISFGKAHDVEHSEIIKRCVFYGNEDHLVTVSKDNTVQLWKPEE
eukprot:GHVH01002230.1.p1 GENE.GHVH01002230.1~~GHVH01002230.1.p1  ORF type:complete len:503 (+),score=73.30 GHVH01002230.1:38-1546(+)